MSDHKRQRLRAMKPERLLLRLRATDLHHNLLHLLGSELARKLQGLLEVF